MSRGKKVKPTKLQIPDISVQNNNRGEHKKGNFYYGSQQSNRPKIFSSLSTGSIFAFLWQNLP